jgi:hypothetical protein
VLEAARTITAWANGFISMELAGAFKLGGDIDRAYEFGITCLTDALGGPVHRPQQLGGPVHRPQQLGGPMHRPQQ